ncbi:putative lipoprotein [Campylobacter insulaenigrae]|uniref:ABC-type transport auxiliary lipoprotein family protein n=1 Tax=Campylobacter insulaenigrae TaxID=260714 RepID=UPI000F70D8DF|nr:ABC-type transport auxiliary lipoprotein family protein [Campylobacter insulaenigrae]MCR6590980.1 ABC-type transport auxiliary lipoprotein family protein [Campylobacter insulaenigrae]MCR6592253.1 ABC-type transport auxiliary lipoprotein family protein [Campylobacter insulaenigrae]VEJ52470.1 putative lipoprotein [Campylobacter insulaenigrae]
MKTLYFVLIALLFSACSVVNPTQTLPSMKYFSINLQNIQINTSIYKDASIIVALPKSLDYSNNIFYKKDEIIYTYAYHFWKENPNLMIKNFLEFNLQNLKIFKAVLNQDSLAKVDFVLESKVNILEQEFLDRTHSKAKFAINLTLVNAKDKNIVASQYFYYEKKLNNTKPDLLIKAYNDIFKQFGEEFSTWMIKNLE